MSSSMPLRDTSTKKILAHLTLEEIALLVYDFKPTRAVRNWLLRGSEGLPKRRENPENGNPLINPFFEYSLAEIERFRLEIARDDGKRRKVLAERMLGILRKLRRFNIPEHIRAWTVTAECDILDGTLPRRDSY